MKKPAMALLFSFLTAACISAMRAGDAGTGNEPEKSGDLALFENGDSLRGSMIGCDKAGLHWMPAYGGGPVVINTKYLKDIQLGPRRIPANAAHSTHVVLLGNGDVLPGAIISLDDKSLLLETWYAGRLTIPRAMIKSIIASDLFGYRGPSGMDEWATGTAAGHDTVWSCKDGILSSSGAGTIGRDLKLNAPSRIQFDLSLRSNSSKTIIYIGSTPVDKPGDSYMLQINAISSTVDASRYSPGNANAGIGQQAKLNISPPDGQADSVKCHFEILVNKEMKTIWLYVNGSLVEQYTGLDDLSKMGGGLIFEPDGASPMEISKIKVSAWGGGLDEASRADSGADHDSIEAAHHGSMRGKLRSIANGKAVFSCSSGDEEIQVGDIGVIRFSTAAVSQAKTEGNEVRALLRAPGRVTMEFESWNEKGVTATSPDFDRAVFSLEVFRFMFFNLQNQPEAGNADAFDINDGGEDE